MLECTKCGFENPDQARFCAGCGLAIATQECQQCKARNAPDARFCISCGHSLSAEKKKQGLLAANAERRVLTVLFCDLVGSTELVDSVDPEVSRQVIRDFQAMGKSVIESFDGRVSTYLGDGIIGLFTHHESNAELAINAALQIMREIDRAGSSFSQADLAIQARAGVATGLAVVGDDMLGHSQVRLETAIGLPMNMAARIQALASPGEVAIDNDSYQAARGLFQVEEMGSFELKGITEQQKLWRVIAERSISSRFVARAAEVLPMVDRTEILQQLMEIWERAVHAQPQLVVFRGEAGVGKSRILSELANIIAIQRDFNHLEYQCSAYHTRTALYPVVNRVKAVAGIEYGDSPEQALSKLELLVKSSSTRLERDMPAFAELLGIDVGERWPSPRMDPDERKERLFDTLIDNMLALSEITPLLISIEDIHWVDPTTLELVGRIARSVKHSRVMVLMSARPDLDPAVLDLPGVTELDVEGLPDKYAQQMLELLYTQQMLKLMQKPDLTAEIRDAIVQHADGIPLYIEELGKTLLENLQQSGTLPGTDSQERLEVSLTLQELTLARLDKLPERAKLIAQVAAVIGRTFPFDLLEKVIEYQDKNLYRDISELLEAQIVVQHKPPPNAEFSFKHALFRDAVYEAILKTNVTAIHEQIAEVLEADYPEVVRNNPGLLARHFGEARVYDKAVEYCLGAARRASQQFALIEARAHITQGLRYVEHLPDGERKKAVTLELLITLGPLLMALEGSGSEVTINHYAQAVALSSQLPASVEQFSALWGQWLVSKDDQEDHGLFWADELQKLAEKLDNRELGLQAHHCHWITYFHLGHFPAARDHIIAGLKLYDHADHSEHSVTFGGHDAKVCGDGFLAHSYWAMGNDRKALLQADECMNWAQKTHHQASVLHANELNMLLQLYRRDITGITAMYEEFNELCADLGLPEYEGMQKHCEGLIKTYQGEVDDGIRLMREGFMQLSEVSTNEDLSLYGEIIAEAYQHAGRFEEGLAQINEVIVRMQSLSAQYWKAEVYRRKGELLAGSKKYRDALQCLETARETAVRQGARMLELRALISLFELNRETGLYPKAESELAQVYGAFEPETSSPEQQRAEQLLAAG